MYYIYYLSVCLFLSGYSDPWDFLEFLESEKQKREYYNSPIISAKKAIVIPDYHRKTNKKTKHPRKLAGWRGKR